MAITDYFRPTEVGAYYNYNSDEKLFRRLDFGLVGGLAYYLNNGLYVGARYQFGLTDVTNDGNDLRVTADPDDPTRQFNQGDKDYTPLHAGKRRLSLLALAFLRSSLTFNPKPPTVHPATPQLIRYRYGPADQAVRSPAIPRTGKGDQLYKLVRDSHDYLYEHYPDLPDEIGRNEDDAETFLRHRIAAWLLQEDYTFGIWRERHDRPDRLPAHPRHQLEGAHGRRSVSFCNRKNLNRDT